MEFSSDGALAESSVSAFTRSRAAFDLKGVMSSLTVIRLRSRDLNLIERQLRAKVMQFPQFFLGAPVVLDVGDIEGGVAGFPLAALVRALSVCKVVPVAVTNIDDAYRTMAASAGLGIVSLSAARPAGDPESQQRQDSPPRPESSGAAGDRRETSGEDRVEPQTRLERIEEARSLRDTPAPQRALPPPPMAAKTPPPAAAKTPPPLPNPPSYAAAVAAVTAAARSAPPPAHRAPMVIRQPVRSGQQIYAEKTDLIVLAPVNPGAQLIADGNIHIYAPLRGRAVAGAKGFSEARVFCQKLEAELIAISGAYVTFDDIPRDRLGKPAQVSMLNGQCVIAAL